MLASELVAFAKRYRSAGCILLASHDQGFAPTLRWSKFLGCTSLVLSQQSGRKRSSFRKGPGRCNAASIERGVSQLHMHAGQGIAGRPCTTTLLLVSGETTHYNAVVITVGRKSSGGNGAAACDVVMIAIIAILLNKVRTCNGSTTR